MFSSTKVFLKGKEVNTLYSNTLYIYNGKDAEGIERYNFDIIVLNKLLHDTISIDTVEYDVGIYSSLINENEQEEYFINDCPLLHGIVPLEDIQEYLENCKEEYHVTRIKEFLLQEKNTISRFVAEVTIDTLLKEII